MYAKSKRTSTPVLFVILVGSLLTLTTFGLLGQQPASAQTPTGTIAYTRDTQAGKPSYDEIRLIEPDGSNDRLLWAIPQPDLYDIILLDWRPDGGELAFTSNHEMGCSFYESDVFAIRPDATGLRRVTNAPKCADLAGYPKGTVTVEVENTSSQSVTLFVYFEGAPEVLFLGLSPFGEGTLTFENVADFGDGVFQFPIANQPPERWFSAGVAADVVVGGTVHAGKLTVAPGTGIREFGARDVSWRHDGAKVGFTQGLAGLYQVAAFPPAGQLGDPLLGTQNLPIFISNVDWGPTASLATQVLYSVGVSNDAGIYQATEGSGSTGVKLVDSPDISTNSIVLDVDWLPDGSGFLYSVTDFFLDYSNIYEYNFATGNITQLTFFDDEFAGTFAISPDGQSIVFERTAVLLPGPGEDTQYDLWMMNRNGTNLQLFVQNGAGPEWSWQTPGIMPFRMYLPAIRS